MITGCSAIGCIHHSDATVYIRGRSRCMHTHWCNIGISCINRRGAQCETNAITIIEIKCLCNIFLGDTDTESTQATETTQRVLCWQRCECAGWWRCSVSRCKRLIQRQVMASIVECAASTKSTHCGGIGGHKWGISGAAAVMPMRIHRTQMMESIRWWRWWCRKWCK